VLIHFSATEHCCLLIHNNSFWGPQMEHSVQPPGDNNDNGNPIGPDIITALKDGSQTSEDIISRIEVTSPTSSPSSTSIPFYVFPLIVLEAAPSKLIDINTTVDSYNALHCLLKLSDKDIKLIENDFHLTRVAIASSLIKLGCSITKEDINKVTPWGEITKKKDEELKSIFLESPHLRSVQLESTRSLYIDHSNSLSSTDPNINSAEVYVGFLNNEFEMQAVKCFLLDSPGSEKKFETEVENMKAVKGSNHVLKYTDYAIENRPIGSRQLKVGFIVMEKSRYTVRDIIDRRKGACKDDDAEEAFRIKILAQTVDAIIYIHKKDSILHRDLKPDNIHVGEDERLVVNHGESKQVTSGFANTMNSR
jgi:hypothetical protein